MGIHRISTGKDEVIEVRIVEFQTAFEEFRQQMRAGVIHEGSREFAEFFDRYDTLLQAFEYLQDAYMVKLKITKPGSYLTRIINGDVEVTQYRAEDNH